MYVLMYIADHCKIFEVKVWGAAFVDNIRKKFYISKILI